MLRAFGRVRAWYDAAPMSSVNLYTKEISLKIVYYGPGLGGKTSSLQYIHRAIKPDSRGQLVSLSTGVDRTLYFDFLPVKLPKLRGYTIRVQLYTVPGQVHYNSTRKLVLTGADGIVFVADSQRRARARPTSRASRTCARTCASRGCARHDPAPASSTTSATCRKLLPVAEIDAALNPLPRARLRDLGHDRARACSRRSSRSRRWSCRTCGGAACGAPSGSRGPTPAGHRHASRARRRRASPDDAARRAARRVERRGLYDRTTIEVDCVAPAGAGRREPEAATAGDPAPLEPEDAPSSTAACWRAARRCRRSCRRARCATRWSPSSTCAPRRLRGRGRGGGADLQRGAARRRRRRGGRRRAALHALCSACPAIATCAFARPRRARRRAARRPPMRCSRSSFSSTWRCERSSGGARS